MAAVPVTIDGVLCDKYGRTLQVVKLVGDLVRTDVGVGGGPMPPGEGGGDRPPVGIWPGPGDPDWPAGSPHPEHPIVIPRPPEGFPNPPADAAVKPPPPGGGWGYHSDYGWGYFPGTGGLPSPKA